MANLDELVANMKTEYNMEDSVFPTGINPLDLLLDGGLSCGITQIVGDNSTGKSTLALQISYSYCKSGKNVLYISTKGDITSEDLKMLNLLEYKDKQFIYVCEGIFDKVENLLNKFINTGEISLIVIDSIASLMNSGYFLTNSKAIKSDNGNSGYNSKPLSILVKKLAIWSYKKNIAVIAVNQYRNTIQMYGKNAGTKTKIAGPKSLINESKYVVEIHSINESNHNCKDFRDCFFGVERLNKGKPFELYMNKGRHPGATLPYFFEYGNGYNSIYPLVKFSLEKGIIVQNGTYYSIEVNDIKCKGMNNFLVEFQKQLPDDYSSYVDQYYISLLTASAVDTDTTS